MIKPGADLQAIGRLAVEAESARRELNKARALRVGLLRRQYVTTGSARGCNPEADDAEQAIRSAEEALKTARVKLVKTIGKVLA